MSYVGGVLRRRMNFAGPGAATQTITIDSDNQANIIYIDGSAPVQVLVTVRVGATIVWDGYFTEPFNQNLGQNGVSSGIKGDDITVTASAAANIFIGYRLLD